jgi:hypothetical protein
VSHGAEVTRFGGMNHGAEVAAPGKHGCNGSAHVVGSSAPRSVAPSSLPRGVSGSFFTLLSLTPFRHLSLISLSSLRPLSRIFGAAAAASSHRRPPPHVVVAATATSANRRGRWLRSPAPPPPAPPAWASESGLGSRAPLRSLQGLWLPLAGRPRRRRPAPGRRGGWDF